MVFHPRLNAARGVTRQAAGSESPTLRSLTSRWPALALGALAFGALACSEPEPPAPPVAAPQQEAPATPQVTGPRTFDRDGVLARADVEVFDSPLPVQTFTVSASDRWAGYQSRHDYHQIIRFYQKNLGNRYDIKHLRGGAKLVPKDGQGTEIFVALPQSDGAPTRVYFFGQSDGLEPPPVITQRGEVDGAAEGSRPRVANNDGGAGGRDGASAQNGAQEAQNGGENYIRQETVGPDGSKVIVLRPAPAPEPTSSRDPSADPDIDYARRRKDSRFGGTHRREIPEGTLY